MALIVQWKVRSTACLLIGEREATWPTQDLVKPGETKDKACSERHSEKQKKTPQQTNHKNQHWYSSWGETVKLALSDVHPALSTSPSGKILGYFKSRSFKCLLPAVVLRMQWNQHKEQPKSSRKWVNYFWPSGSSGRGPLKEGMVKLARSLGPRETLGLKRVFFKDPFAGVWSSGLGVERPTVSIVYGHNWIETNKIICKFRPFFFLSCSGEMTPRKRSVQWATSLGVDFKTKRKKSASTVVQLFTSPTRWWLYSLLLIHPNWGRVGDLGVTKV